MRYLQKIWNNIYTFIRRRRKKSNLKVYQDAKKTIEKVLDKEEILIKASKTDIEEERQTILKPLVDFLTAEQIIDTIETGTIFLKDVKPLNKRKFLYNLHELLNEIESHQSKLVLLDVKIFSIKDLLNLDTSSLDEKVNNLFEIIKKNELNHKITFSESSHSTFESNLKQIERILNEKSTLSLYKNREKEKKKQREIYENKTKKELNNIDTLIRLNQLDDAKIIIHKLKYSIKPEYKKVFERLSRAETKLKEKELELFKKRQAEITRQQQEKVKRIAIELEKKLEEQKIEREQIDAIRRIEEDKINENKSKLNALLTKKFNWRDFQNILNKNNITEFYHFTDISNIKSIKEKGGLFSWYHCDLNRIVIPMPGGSIGSRQNDTINGKKDFVRVAFNKEHPMLYIALKDRRISKPVWLNIAIDVAYFEHTEFSDKNAAAYSSYTPIIGKETQHLSNIRFDILKKAERVKHYNLSDNEKPYNQAEVLVKTWIPIEYIKNIESIAE